MKSYFQALLCALLVSMPTVNASVAFKESLVTSEGDIRLVFTLDKVALLNAYALDDPSRIVIDIKDVAMGEIKSTKLGPVQSIRGIQESNLTRLVIDLNGSVYWKKPWQVKKKEEVLLILEMKNNQTTSRNTRDILVAIDAGHGGKDPGAVGKNILEKDVTRMIAKELERTLRDTKGYQPIMIRKGDTFVNLDDRYQIAREQGADLFVSIHADGFRLSSVKGASVFVWSEEASSITADNLSKKVLTTDPAVKAKIGKLDVRDFDEDAARALYEIAYEAKIENSTLLANHILKYLKADPFTKMHKNQVEYADFRVLKSVDIPSVLVESGFISNPDDAKRLAGKPGRRMIARGIFLGLHDYFKDKPKPNTIMDNYPGFLIYKVQSGDVLSEIAIRFGVSVSEIIAWNNLGNNPIFPGQEITIRI